MTLLINGPVEILSGTDAIPSGKYWALWSREHDAYLESHDDSSWGKRTSLVTLASIDIESSTVEQRGGVSNVGTTMAAGFLLAGPVGGLVGAALGKSVPAYTKSNVVFSGTLEDGSRFLARTDAEVAEGLRVWMFERPQRLALQEAAARREREQAEQAAANAAEVREQNRGLLTLQIRFHFNVPNDVDLSRFLDDGSRYSLLEIATNAWCVPLNASGAVIPEGGNSRNNRELGDGRNSFYVESESFEGYYVSFDVDYEEGHAELINVKPIRTPREVSQLLIFAGVQEFVANDFSRVPISSVSAKIINAETGSVVLDQTLEPDRSRTLTNEGGGPKSLLVGRFVRTERSWGFSLVGEFFDCALEKIDASRWGEESLESTARLDS